jgi:hypothetical protein
MNCVGCGAIAVTERPEVTARGYRRFRCRDCGRQFNERSGGVLNRTCLPSDIVAFVAFGRLRYRLTLRDLSEILLLRGIEVSHERPFVTGRPSCCRSWARRCASVGTNCGAIGRQLVCRRDVSEGPGPVALPLSGGRPERKPDRHHAERAPRHEGRSGLLPLGQGHHGLSRIG